MTIAWPTRVLSAGLLCLGLTGVAAQVKVGEHYPIYVDSARHYAGTPHDGVQQVWSHELHHPGATYIALHFSEFELAPGDYLVVADANGDQAYRLAGRGKRAAGTFWARHIKGDTARLELYAASPAGGRGFVIDELAAGTAAYAARGIEAICGADDKQNAVCYKSSHPIEYDRGRAVARLLISGGILCTGWLVSSSNDVLTNEHCISTAVQALNTDFEFMAEAPDCSYLNCQQCYPGTVYSGATFVADNPDLDYALVRIAGGDPAAVYGYLEIDDRAPIVGEPIYIPQHPGGRAKELAIYSSDPSDASGLCEVTTVAAPTCTGVDGYHDVGYACDTEGGSSGSPVLAGLTHKVIALHHCADCPNRAVPIQPIYAEIQTLLGPQCQVDADCDDLQYCTGYEYCVNTVCIQGPPPCAVGAQCEEVADTCIQVCDGDGVCELEEDCNTCSRDCISGTIVASSCGNAICEIDGGENCLNCPEDCNGKANGPANRRFCCGAGVGCQDPRCESKGEACTQAAAFGTAYCCGDGQCSPGEDGQSCGIDCPAGSGVCDGDAICEGGEDCLNCPSDCEGNLGGKPDHRYCCGNGIVEGPENPLFCDNNF
jgi:hypothetical protein